MCYIHVFSTWVKNIVLEKCKIIEAGKAGIGITTNDGGHIDNLAFRNIKMQKIATPFFVNVSARLRAPGQREIGRITNLCFTKINAKKVENQHARTERKWWPATISGSSGNPVENVEFKDVRIVYKGGGNLEDSNILVPELVSAASPRHLKIRPSYGFYLRHVNNITFTNCKIGLLQKDMRPALFLEGVYGMVSDNFNFTSFSDALKVIIKNSKKINLSGAKDLQYSKLEVDGDLKIKF